jgi:quercetin dioxygenase-like cupin family protein
MTDTSPADLNAVGSELLKRAAASPTGRATQLVHSAPEAGLSHVLLAIREGSELADHENPGEATLHVLSGRMRLSSADETWTLTPGELLVIPHRRHAVYADEDSVCMLTIVKAQKKGHA